MKKIFTFIALSILLTTQAFSQICTINGGTCPVLASETFDNSANGFTGDFAFGSQGGNGRLESTPVSSGTSKVLRTPTLFCLQTLHPLVSLLQKREMLV